MAFNFLIDLSGRSSNWIEINSYLKSITTEGIEAFPIPDFFNSGNTYIGVSIIKGDTFNPTQMKMIIEYFIQERHTVFELYGGDEVTMDNVNDLISKI